MLLWAIVTALLASCQGAFSPGKILQQLGVLRGSSFLERVGDHCRKPLKEFGWCLVGKDPQGKEFLPASRLGQKFWRRGQRQMKKLREQREIRILEDIGKNVEKCFDFNKCTLKPMEAVKCFLDFVIHGGPYDRVAQCIVGEWGTPSLDVSVPELADLGGLEDDVKLFAGLGLYKRWQRDPDAFWGKMRAQLQVLCQGGPESLRRAYDVANCTEAAIARGEREYGGPLWLDLDGLLGGAPKVVGLSEDAFRGVGAFGDPKDLQALIQLLTQRVMACGIDFFGSAREAVRAIRAKSPCAMPVCLHFLWTVKDALCTTCRGSLARPQGLDPFNSVKRFLRAVAAEYVEVGAGGYDCGLGRRDCRQCQTAAEDWQENDTKILRGFAAEAASVLKLFRDVCNFGPENPRRLSSDSCDWNEL